MNYSILNKAKKNFAELKLIKSKEELFKYVKLAANFLDILSNYFQFSSLYSDIEL